VFDIEAIESRFKPRLHRGDRLEQARHAMVHGGIMGHVHRRRFMTTIGALLAGPLSRAQQAGRTYRVAIVHTTTRLGALAGPNPEHTLTRLILHELRDLGYVEGRNLIFDRRSAEGDLGFELQPVVAHPSDPEVSFARIMQLRVDGMLVEATSTNYGHRKQLGRLAYEARLLRSIPLRMRSRPAG
jgi:hypothetical protein